MKQKRMMAAAKVAYGVGRMGYAIATATGHTFIGAMLRHNHMMAGAARIGKDHFIAGKEAFDEGVSEWKEAE